MASGVSEIEITIYDNGDKKETEKRTMTPNSINEIEITRKQKVHLKWKSKKSKFDAELFGSDLGILIDTRERRINAS